VLAVDYLDQMTAPSKEVVWFEHSDEPAAFNNFMVSTVLAQTQQ
jgi:hypothetical protein